MVQITLCFYTSIIRVQWIYGYNRNLMNHTFGILLLIDLVEFPVYFGSVQLQQELSDGVATKREGPIRKIVELQNKASKSTDESI